MPYAQAWKSTVTDQEAPLLRQEFIADVDGGQVSRQLCTRLVELVVAFTLALAVNCMLQTAPTVHAASCFLTVPVRRGETLSSIGKTYHTSVQGIAQANAIADINLIFPGQRLCIPQRSAQAMIEQVFGPYAQEALRVAVCESGLNPSAFNHISVDGSHAEGIFQILYPSTWMSTSQAGNSPYNAGANILAAHEIFARDGKSWQEWACSP